MTLKTARLTAPSLKTKPDGKHRDSHGLVFEVKGGSRRWTFHYSWQGNPVELALGKLATMGLADARSKAKDLHAAKAAGIDPRTVLKPVVIARDAVTFETDVDSYFEREHRQWKPTHAAGWKRYLKKYAEPLYTVATADITDADVLAVIEPMWLSKHVTADRVLCRIRAVIDLAIQLHPKRFAGGLNPCIRARAMLANGARPAVVNRPAMAWEDLPAFYARLVQDTGMDSYALQFLLLNGCPRVSEVIDATWSEIVGDRWSVPAEHTKNKNPRVNKLTPESLAILAAIKPAGAKPTDFIFASLKTGGKMGDNAPLRLLNEMGETTTVHGFRTCFTGFTVVNHRDYYEESQMLLDHKTTGPLGTAYNRERLLEQRFELCGWWAAYLTSAITQPGLAMAA
jgi:integrase